MPESATLASVAPPAAAPLRTDGPTRRRADEVRRRELAAFLRSCRERIAPEQVGMPAGGRRRTPGLRREEVAQLAGVGVTWYTWLEQGRDIRVSDQVLDAIARTLLFDPHERAHLFTLAGSPPPTTAQDCRELYPSAHIILDQLEPFPACVTNSRYDLLAFNRTYAHLVEDLEALPFADRNSLWLMVTHPAWRAAYPDREDAVRRMVAQYRAAMAEFVAEPAWKCLVARLRRASPEFATLWDQHDVGAPENRTKHVLNPRVGLLRLDYTNLWFGQRLCTRWSPTLRPTSRPAPASSPSTSWSPPDARRFLVRRVRLQRCPGSIAQP